MGIVHLRTKGHGVILMLFLRGRFCVEARRAPRRRGEKVQSRDNIWSSLVLLAFLTSVSRYIRTFVCPLTHLRICPPHTRLQHFRFFCRLFYLCLHPSVHGTFRMHVSYPPDTCAPTHIYIHASAQTEAYERIWRSLSKDVQRASGFHGPRCGYTCHFTLLSSGKFWERSLKCSLCLRPSTIKFQLRAHVSGNSPQAICSTAQKALLLLACPCNGRLRRES
jgi:hypothetical protein